MPKSLYSTLRWRAARQRALERDSNRCTVSRLLGGDCAAQPLHVHHIVPVEEGGQLYALENLGTTCASHHPVWESLRRKLVSSRTPIVTPVSTRCPHNHRSAEARAICEARRARQLGA